MKTNAGKSTTPFIRELTVLTVLSNLKFTIALDQLVQDLRLIHIPRETYLRHLLAFPPPFTIHRGVLIRMKYPNDS